jgi:hypothetical protein
VIVSTFRNCTDQYQGSGYRPGNIQDVSILKDMAIYPFKTPLGEPQRVQPGDVNLSRITDGNGAAKPRSEFLRVFGARQSFGIGVPKTLCGSQLEQRMFIQTIDIRGVDTYLSDEPPYSSISPTRT